MSIIPGLMTVSYNHSFREGKMTPERMMDRTEELGLKSTEWCHFACHEPGKVDWDQVKLLDRLGREKGIKNSVAGWAPLLAEEDRRDMLLGRAKTQLEVSKFIGADRLRFHSSVETEIGIGTPPPLDEAGRRERGQHLVHRHAGAIISLHQFVLLRNAVTRLPLA